MTLWVSSGTIENWNTSIEQDGEWGVRQSHMLRDWWREIKSGDYIIMYANMPVSDIIGVGEIESTYKSGESLWENQTFDTQYPLRIKYDPLYIRDLNNEETSIETEDLIMNIQGGLKPVRDRESKKKLKKRMGKEWEINI